MNNYNLTLEQVKEHAEDKDYILNVNDIRDMYGFWKYTYPVNND